VSSEGGVNSLSTQLVLWRQSTFVVDRRHGRAVFSILSMLGRLAQYNRHSRCTRLARYFATLDRAGNERYLAAFAGVCKLSASELTSARPLARPTITS
jgi:hypothetical protein